MSATREYYNNNYEPKRVRARERTKDKEITANYTNYVHTRVLSCSAVGKKALTENNTQRIP